MSQSKNKKKNKKFKLQTKTPTGYISTSHCDQLSKLKGLDVEELLIEIEAYFLQLRPKLGFSSEVTFGIEIEFENAFYRDVENEIEENIRNNWILKGDGTVSSSQFGRSCGGEINSPILKDINQSWIDVNKVCQMLKEKKAKAENRAGGHIHFGTQIIGKKPLYWVNLIKLWTIYERIILRFSFGDKLGPRDNLFEYASPMSTTMHNKLSSISSASSINEIVNSVNYRRYQAINFQNVKSSEYGTDNTIELRCPNSSISAVVWQNNINFFGKMFLYCKNQRFDEDFISWKLKKYSPDDYQRELYDEIYLQEALELSDLLFTNNLDKVYFLKQYLKSFEYQRSKKDNVKQIAL